MWKEAGYFKVESQQPVYLITFFSFIGYTTYNGRMIVNDEFERIWDRSWSIFGIFPSLNQNSRIWDRSWSIFGIFASLSQKSLYPDRVSKSRILEYETGERITRPRVLDSIL
jgi:hypothetical protein